VKIGNALRRFFCFAIVTPLLASCSGIQSALDPAGEEATQVFKLFWMMTVGGAAIWAGVVVLSLYASRWKAETISEKAAGQVIIWAGVAFPVTVLAALLGYALWLMPSLRPFANHATSTLNVEVVGNQFWWHVIYRRPDRKQVVSANEIRLPVGERVEFTLRSADMIHSFWIPPLGGKMDMIPGRTNRLSLLATRAGTYRGQCAEFCGTSHASMALPAVAMEPAAFQSWLDARSEPSSGLDAGATGAKLFLDKKCGDCHRVDGFAARGTAGPDLSHIGSRLTVGAGMMENTVESIARFITHSGSIKPGSKMPAYVHLSDEELSEMSVWLKALR
jgi:cytochrome c oxidase subunit 2